MISLPLELAEEATYTVSDGVGVQDELDEGIDVGDQALDEVDESDASGRFVAASVCIHKLENNKILKKFEFSIIP